MEVKQSMNDYQSVLMDLYSGQNKEWFKSIVPTCSECGLIAYVPYNSSRNAKALVCSLCLAKSGVPSELEHS